DREGILFRIVGGEAPGEDVGVEHVPLIARLDAGADLGAGFDQALGGQHLDRLAQDRPADPETDAEVDLAGQDLAGREVTAQDLLADLVGDAAMDAALRKHARRLAFDLHFGPSQAPAIRGWYL